MPSRKAFTLGYNKLPLYYALRLQLLIGTAIVEFTNSLPHEKSIPISTSAGLCVEKSSVTRDRAVGLWVMGEQFEGRHAGRVGQGWVSG